jgi:hypothetical protein
MQALALWVQGKQAVTEQDIRQQVEYVPRALLLLASACPPLLRKLAVPHCPA